MGTVAQARAPAGRDLYALVAALARPLVRGVFRPAVCGADNVPEGPFVLAANQLSNLDGIGLAYGLSPRRLRWMGKAELFRGPAAPLLRALGVFPVRRGSGDLAALETAAAHVRAGDPVALFPEGTRRAKGWRKHRVARPHVGAARIALVTGAPLVPAAIVGTERLLRLRRWRIAYGPPVSCTALPENARLAARELTRRLMESISALEAGVARERAASRRRLHPRLLLDLCATDVAAALAACVVARRGRAERRVLATWAGGAEGLACLSLRSAFDLLLAALELEPGDEVAFSALTHP